MVKKSSYKVIWEKKTLDHLIEILEYLHSQSEQAPKLVKQALFKRIKDLSKNPFICEVDKLKTPIDTNFRAFLIYSYRITYQVVPQNHEIRILRIRHTSREPMGY